VSTTASAENLNAIRDVGAALQTRTDEIAQSMVRRIAAEVPAYGRSGGPLLDDVLELSTMTAQVLGDALAGARQVRRDDVPLVREHAARRLRQGIELESFLHAYRSALFHYWDACSDEASRLGISREASLALARFALDAIDTITTHAAEAYLREDARQRTQSGRAARDLAEQLITGQSVRDDRRHPAAPGLDPRGRLVAVVGHVETSPVAVIDALQLTRELVGESMALGKRQPLATVRQGEIVVIAAGASASDAVPRLRMARRRALDEQGIDVRFGVSTSAVGFAGTPRAYEEAVSALSYTTPTRPVVALSDLSSLECALIAADATTQAVVASKGHLLYQLADGERAIAMDTIRAFASADMSISRAAAEIGVHPNTVRYRLGRIAQTTGHDPRTFAGLVELVCAAELSDDRRRGGAPVVW
jgi:hypothetical protein